DNVYDNENDNEPSARRSRKSEAFGDIEKAKNIISYLNEKTDSNFSAENETTLRHINARLREGYKEVLGFSKVAFFYYKSYRNEIHGSFCFYKRNKFTET
ncbi:MAG: hypothetical protein E7481_08015, partial [Ruminococcaceae bacterium]|nr:hypothetical protein [Oscillospiraceae bacterium]